LPIRVISGMLQLYIEIIDMMSSSTIYTSLMAIDWGLEHLEQCGWYLNCPKNKTFTIEIIF
jgi:hypothetical protein